MMREATMLALTGAVLSISCSAVGTSRGLTLLLVVVTGALTWVAHRRAARAGGVDDTAGSTGQTTGSASTGEASTAGDAISGTGTETSGSDTSSTTGSPPATGGEAGTGPCLSIGMPDPEVGACLCACDTQGDDGKDWTPALLLPLLVRRRSRREALEHLAAEERLPADVVARLRRGMEDEARHEDT